MPVPNELKVTSGKIAIAAELEQETNSTQNSR
jgi:hypothetical protein